MDKKKLIINIFFQLAAISVISSFFIFDYLDISKIQLTFSNKFYGLIILLLFLKVFIASLFYIIVNTISNRRNNFLNITNTFLQGGIVNMFVPGLGLIFKYYKFKIDMGITFAQYSVSQSLLSLSSLAAYILLGFLFSFIKIVNIDLENFLIVLLIFFLLIILLIIYRKSIYHFVKKKILEIKKINSIYKELSLIKTIIIKKKFNFLYIWIGFFLLAFLECYSFFLTIKVLGFDISFVNSNFIYISSSLVTVISMFNFIGLFELILSISASFLKENFIDMMLIGLGFKLLNTSSLLSVIIINRLIFYLKK
jgi:hypothetical protein